MNPESWKNAVFSCISIKLSQTTTWATWALTCQLLSSALIPCVAKVGVPYYRISHQLSVCHLEVWGEYAACGRGLELLGMVRKSSSKVLPGHGEMEDGEKEESTAHHDQFLWSQKKKISSNHYHRGKADILL